MCVVRSNISVPNLERGNLSWAPWSLDLSMTINIEMTFQAWSLVVALGTHLELDHICSGLAKL